jgi:tetratricopeptide (TPR) repeat protein
VARLVRERTDGNPLFLVTLVDHLLARGAIVEREGRWYAAKELRDELAAVPESLRRLIEQQLERVAAEDRELLDAASLVGFEFSAAAAAAGANCDPVEVEKRLERLADGSPFLRRAGRAAWPDGTVAACFAFRHPLYPETLAAGVPARRRADSHLRIGTVLERAHGRRSGELGAELALHFEEGGDRARAVRYRRLAAQTAAGRRALVEVEAHLEKGLALLEGLPASPERDHEELLLQTMVGSVRMATRGYAAPEAGRAYARALELSREAPHTPWTFRVLWGLWTFNTFRGELDRALELAEQNRVIAEARGDRLMRLVAHQGLWTTHFFRGELAAALHHLDEGEPLYEPIADAGTALIYGLDAKVSALSHRAYVVWALGGIDQAVEVSRQAVEHARVLGYPMTLASAMIFAAWIRYCRREPDACFEEAEAVIAHATEHGLPYWMPIALELRGWALVERGEIERGIGDLEHGLGSWTAGAGLGRSRHLANLAAAKVRAGRLDQARALLEECKALATATGERYHEPEIHRLDAELVLAEAGSADRAPPGARERAEALLHAAIECAGRQGSRTLELRALTALARLCRRGARARQVRTRLVELLACFSEGFETADLQEPRRLVAR